LQQKGLKTLL